MMRSAGTMAAVVVASLVAIFTVALAVSAGSSTESGLIQDKLVGAMPDDLMLISLFEVRNPPDPYGTSCPEVELQIIIGNEGLTQINWYSTIQQFHGCAVDLPMKGLPTPFSSQQLRVSDEILRELMTEMSTLDWPSNATFVRDLNDIVGYTNGTCRSQTYALATDSVAAGVSDGTIVYEIHRSAPSALSYSTYSDATVDPALCRASAQRDEAIIDRMLAKLPIQYPANVIRR